MRIVSLLPSTTEILFDLGAGDDVVGVTFECDTPPEARTRRIVSSTTLPEGLSPTEIDTECADSELPLTTNCTGSPSNSTATVAPLGAERSLPSSTK